MLVLATRVHVSDAQRARAMVGILILLALVMVWSYFKTRRDVAHLARLKARGIEVTGTVSRSSRKDSGERRKPWFTYETLDGDVITTATKDYWYFSRRHLDDGDTDQLLYDPDDPEWVAFASSDPARVFRSWQKSALGFYAVWTGVVLIAWQLS